ncbi:hypothetical protein [Pseudoxanthomonas suwonensis]|uniref:hypothetical protein n=1 Tax=Pseudoxanthomonas suwonensis TaxID=314722 RepID=UPI00138F106C|nr:hypothetical protein [Pseudoxanthomonas suwonensis]
MIASTGDRVMVLAVVGMEASYDAVEEQVSLQASGGEHTRDAMANHAGTSGSPMRSGVPLSITQESQRPLHALPG